MDKEEAVRELVRVAKEAARLFESAPSDAEVDGDLEALKSYRIHQAQELRAALRRVEDTQ